MLGDLRENGVALLVEELVLVGHVKERNVQDKRPNEAPYVARDGKEEGEYGKHLDWQKKLLISTMDGNLNPYKNLIKEQYGFGFMVSCILS